MNAHANTPDLIKKHANRRLYSIQAGAYVNLEDLAEMARAGREFVVVDTRTQEHITHATLAQILLAQESRTQENLLTADFMLKLIRLRGDTLGAYVPDYLHTTLRLLSEQRGEAAHSGAGNA